MDENRTIVLSREEIDGKCAGASMAAGTGACSRSFRELAGMLFLCRRDAAPDSPAEQKSCDEFILPDNGTDEFPADLKDISAFYVMAEQPFAAGGMGELRTAEDRFLGRTVAVKSLHTEFSSDDKIKREFFSEAQLTAALDHPAIIPVYGLYSDAGKGMCLAMKLIEGYTLREFLNYTVRMYQLSGIRSFDEKKSLRNRLELFIRVCEAVEYAHSAGVVHRDLKPENIMIGKHREIYVTDWGIARKLQENNCSERLVGTPGYIAPEILAGEKTGFQTDIYALGMILYELVTLAPAFGEGTPAEILGRNKNGRYEPVCHRFKCRIDSDLKAIIRKAVSPVPPDRYTSAAELAEELRRYSAREEVSANPDNVFRRAARWGIHHSSTMLLIILLLFFIGAASLIFTLLREVAWGKEIRKRDNAVSFCYSETVKTANYIENSISRIRYQVKTLQQKILLASLVPDAGLYGTGENIFVPYTAYLGKNPPESFQHNAVHQQKIDPDGVLFFNSGGNVIPETQLESFAPVARYMRHMMLKAGLPDDAALEEARAHYISSEKPMDAVFFALADGFYASFPGKTGYPAKFEPEKRPWYDAAVKAKGEPVWTSPYDTAAIGGKVITCAGAVFGPGGKLIGVAGVDLQLKQLADEMFQKIGASNRYVHEKLLFDGEGHLLFKATSPGKKRTAIEKHPELMKHLLSQKHGSIVFPHKDREWLIVFAYITSLDLLYAECVDLGMILEDDPIQE